MKLATKLVILGSVIAAAGTVVVLLRRNRSEHDRPRRVATVRVDLGHPIEPYEPGEGLVEEATVIATNSGLVGVDPEPLAQPAGERIQDLREGLPRPGKGI